MKAKLIGVPVENGNPGTAATGDRARTRRRLRTPYTGRIFVGTAGWSIPRVSMGRCPTDDAPAAT
jgi:hypothetical protein